jgi:hypothetical protein
MQPPIIDHDLDRKRVCTPEEARALLDALRTLHRELLSPLAQRQVVIALAELASERAVAETA